MMKRFLRHPAFIWCVRLVVAAVLIYAALQKIWMPLEFARLIREYHLLPEQFLNLAAVILPWLELVCGCCFVTGIGLMGTAFLLSALNSVFVVAIIYRAWLIMRATGVAKIKVIRMVRVATRLICWLRVLSRFMKDDWSAPTYRIPTIWFSWFRRGS